MKYLIRFNLIFMLFLLLGNNAQAQISMEFYQALPKKFKPKDPSKLTSPEKEALLNAANVQFSLEEFNPELDKIANQLYLDIKPMSNKADRIDALYTVIFYMRSKSNPSDVALSYVNELITEINDDPHYSADLAATLSIKGNILLEKGKIEQGIIALKTAERLSLATKPANKQLLGSVYSMLAYTYIMLDLYDQAISYIDLARPYLNTLKPEQIKNVHVNINQLNKAMCYIGSYQLKDHVVDLDSATTLISKVMKTTDYTLIASCYGLFAKISYLKKQYRQSVLYLDSADISKYAKADISGLLPERIAYRGLNLLRQGSLKEGGLLIKKSISLNDEVTLPLPELYHQLYNIYSETGDWKSASQYLKQYIDKKDSVDVIRKNIALADINEKYKSAQKETQIQRLKTVQIVQQKQQRLTLLLAIVVVLSLLLIIIVIYFFNKRKLDKQVKRQQELENENLRISQSLMDQETKMLEERYESLKRLRSEISNDMHNELGSALVSLNFYVDDVQHAFKDETTVTALTKIKEEVSSIYAQTRDYIHALQENVKDIKFDLVNFLLYLPLHFNQNTTLQIKTDIAINQLESRLTVVQNNEFYLFVKEALANILKHSNATFFTIKINFSEQNCEFLISDNGRGFDLKAESPGLGLKNMKERIFNLNGELTIKSDKNGTTFSGFFPVIRV